MTAFKNLPPWSDFEKGRDSDMLRMRNAYIEKLWDYHRKTLRRHSQMRTATEEEAAHDAWDREKAASDASDALPKEPPRMPCLACAELWS